MSVLRQRLDQRISQLRQQELYRTRRVIEGSHGVELQVNGRHCVNFCSNDYLGLAADPRPARVASKALGRVGTGSGASALISGYNDEHRQLEEALADFTGYPRVLLFSSGWAANCGVLKALLGRGDRLIADELNHASLIDGGRLAGAEYVRVPHADIGEYENALSHHREKQNPDSLGLVVTDAVFSMDGDVAPLNELSALAAQSGASLMVDDAHGFGVLGARGAGACESLAVKPDVYVATLGKALGASGAFVAGSEELIEYLIQRARSWVFSTAPPPAMAAAAREALSILRSEPDRRARLQANIRRLKVGAAEVGIHFDLAEPAVASTEGSAILPLIIGDAAETMRISAELFERGYWVAGIRPPTVAQGTSRLRVTLSATHKDQHIDGLIEALAETIHRPKAAAA